MTDPQIETVVTKTQIATKASESLKLNIGIPLRAHVAGRPHARAGACGRASDMGDLLALTGRMEG
ncbi:hypothetical protein Rleg9DRAFT_1720 [Rhizobium leguminosarum bv. trifolii WSM597]|uniref:Uncharacterized protein n=1 Tax=Rhizobium leguminosarum bv. trifolii WSM597 TaxID=754764 RepID=I9X2H3_RHILT|nr:hypothetical protein Rleg9DRAFT_1720 [Rhizobium leguminosarum bv. trifolii WSM597]